MENHSICKVFEGGMPRLTNIVNVLYYTMKPLMTEIPPTLAGSESTAGKNVISQQRVSELLRDFERVKLWAKDKTQLQ